MSTNTVNGSTDNDILNGSAGEDSLLGLAGDDTLRGGAGNDTVDGGSGYNTYRVTGTADAFYWSINSSGAVVLTDAVTDGVDSIDGSDEGVDTLTNIQAIQYVRPDGSVESTVQLDDYSNSADAGNTQIQYGTWVNGRANFYGDVDYFKLQTTAGQKVVLSGGQGSSSGYLTSSGYYYGVIQFNDGYVWSDSDKSLTWNATGSYDVYWRSSEPSLSASSPMSSKGYGFILRRQLDGTDSADTLNAGSDYEQLVGGLGNDTLNGSDRSDYLDGGAGDDLLSGGKGNDELDGGAGTANVAVYAGNKADYALTWLGGNLKLRLSDNTAGRDGTDTLTNVQLLRFADGDIKLDGESNVALVTGLTQIGQTMSGSLPVTQSGDWVDADYFRQKFSADISTSTALRISMQVPHGGSYGGTLYFQFQANGSSDVLTFNNLGSSGTVSQFNTSISPGSQQSWIVSPKYWGSSTDYVAMSQLADVRVWGYAYTGGAPVALGDLAGYQIKVDRVLYGTTGADTLVGDGLSGYIDARDGNDSVTGSTIDEQIVGGAGDDSLAGGAGNDVLTDGLGRNQLDGGAGDDVIDLMANIPVSGGPAPTATVIGGEGTDTLKIASGTNWAGLSVSGVEVLDGSGGTVSLTPNQVIDKGFTTAQNLTFRLDPNLTAGGTLDASALAGNFNLRGTNQGDTLTGNAGNNTIYLSSDQDGGSGMGADTVAAGAGDDIISIAGNWSWWNWSQYFSSVDTANHTYKLNGSIDGGAGTDRLEFDIDSLQYTYHAWGGYFNGSAWKLDLTGLSLVGVESLVIKGNTQSTAYPAEVIQTSQQLAALNHTAGLPPVSIVGGGEVDLTHLAAIGVKTWRLGDAAAYTVNGSDGVESLTVGAGSINAQLGAGNDEFVIDSKPLVTDTLAGGEGSDTLTIRGSDVDLSGSTLSGIEAIKVSSSSLSMTAEQWASLGSSVSRVSGTNTGFILSVTEPGTTTLAAESPYVGLTGSSGDDRLIGNAGDNVLVGGAGNDALLGNAGNDRLVTGAGVDTLQGGDGDDKLVVTGKTTVRDELSGGAGIDTLLISEGQDLTGATLSGVEVLKGSGTVTLTAAQLAAFNEISGVTVQLAGGDSAFALGSVKVGAGATVLLPSADALVPVTSGAVIGSKGDDTISGGAGDDYLIGGRGGDLLSGGAGADTLVGGSGVDTLSGGAGSDRFVVEGSEFTNAPYQSMVVNGAQGNRGYFDGRSLVVYADAIDGGTGNDTLQLDFGTASSSGYVINAGTVSNVENLSLNFSSSWNSVALDASTFKQFSKISAEHSWSATPSRYEYVSLGILGNQEDLNFDAIDSTAKIREIVLQGSYNDIDARHFTVGPNSSWNDFYNNAIKVWSFDSSQLSDGNDGLIVYGDTSFNVQANGGDDQIQVNASNSLNATVDGGAGNDTLDFSGSDFIDISGAAISNVETVRYGSSTLVVSQEQLESLSFDGSGAKFLRSGSTIVGTTGNDSYSGDGTGSFQGGKGDDSISNLDTAVFSGNYADYDFTRSGNQLTVQQSRGAMTDGKDTVTGVMNLKFADTTLKIDDAPDSLWLYVSGQNYDSLTHVDYSKRVSAKKDYASDSDVFSATLAPSSPLAIDGSSFNGSGWRMSFTDVSTGQQLQFKSLVYGWINWDYYSWMSADAKWLPGFQTSEGFKAYQGGDVVFQVNVDGGIQDYAFTLNFLDDYAGSVDTLGAMDPQVGVVKGYVGEIGDADWIRTQLIAGTKYEFKLQGLASGGGTLVDPKLQLLDSQGRVVESGFDLASDVVGNDDTLVFRPTETGTYYLAVTDVAQVNTGSWTLTQKSLDMIAGNTSTTERIEWSGAQTFTVSSEINVLSDHDWFKVWLDKGVTYDFRALGSSQGGTLADPQLSLRSVTGILLAQDDNSGGSTDAKLVYSAADSGWYFLDAGASGNASKGTYVLKGSTLADDYGNNLLTTGLVQSTGVPVQGLVSYNGDSDWFKVGLSKGKTYVIDLVVDISDSAQLDPLVDPLLIVRDAEGNVLFRADDFGGTLNSRAYFTPTADGLYYLEAKSAFKYDIGAYQLSVSLAPADDFVDQVGASAKALTLGTAQHGTLGIPGDRDMFQVSLEAGKVYQVSVEGLAGHAGTLADPYLRVFDAKGHLVDFDNNGGAGNDAQLYLAPAASGIYYVEASASKDRGMGTYQVSVAQRDLPPDDVPNDLSSKVFLTPGDSFSGNLLTHNDQDWFGIKLSAGKDYVFRLQASASGNGTLNDPVLEIRAADGTLIKSVDNLLIGNEPATPFTPVADGTYYLVVKAADGQTDTGSYTLVTRQPDDHSNTKPGATTIALNQTLDGGIQWSDGAFGVRAYDSVGLATDTDEDWFQFSASQGQVLSVNVKLASGSALSRPMVEVVDKDGRSLALGDGLETKDGLAVATFKAAADGTYWARVIDGAGATGSYQISLTEGDASDEDAQTPVALDFASSGAVAKAEATARIGLAGDSDHFSVALQQGHSYRIETLAVRDGTQAPLASASLGLNWLAQGASTAEPVEVTRETGQPSFFDSTLFTASSSGIMSIAVQPLDPLQTGAYKLRVIDLGTSLADARPDQASDYVDATHGVLASNDNAGGRIDSADDADLFAINLTAGNLYDFSVKGFADGLGTLAQGQLRLLDSKGQLVSAGRFDGEAGRTGLSVSVFDDGRYYLAVTAADLPGNAGTYVLESRLRGSDELPTDDIAADTRSGVSAAPGKPATGKVDYVGDHDWIRVSLEAGKVYVLDVLADGDGAGGTLKDATLRLLDGNGNELAFDDDSGAGLDSHLQFTPGSSGDYYLDIGSNGTETGSYTARVRELYSGVADPLKSAQWYLSALGLEALNGQITGAGVTVGMIDDGIDTAHPDLQKQIDFALSYDAWFDTQDGKHKSVLEAHGTAVSGIIVGEQNNETGIVGVAPDAEIASVRVGWDWASITQALGQQWQFDVSNNSWGAINPFSDNFNSTSLTFAYQALRTGVEDGRDGKGTVFVFSAGNSAAYGENTNYHNFQNAREVITVAAANADGSVASFSTPGASVLVGAYGVDLLTTDRHEKGLGYNKTGNYTSFSGTSAAAPVVSGVVALMLEANPELGYRDVQQILAYSAWHPDSMDWKVNAASNWNLGGLKFNDSLGFGVVDAYSAVCLADTWLECDTAINEVSDSARAFGLKLAIPDGNNAISKTFTIDNAMLVEHVELGVDLRHTRLGDLIIEITSPNGTVSRLMDRPTVNAEQPFGLSGADSGVPTHLLWDFSSSQFWGEEAVGEWTVTVRDVRAEETGTLSSLSLRVYGERDDGNDVYIFTEEGFKSLADRVLADERGTDTINASPMVHDMYVDLSAGKIAAESVVYEIEDWSVIENAITGTGDDRLVGNDAANLVDGRGGNDTLEGGVGNDTLIGGAGRDTVVYAGKMAEYSRSWNPDTKTVTVIDNLGSNGNDGTDTLKGIERIVFADGELNLGSTVGNKAPVASSTLFDSPVFLAKGMGIAYDLPDNAFSDADGSSAKLQVEVSSAAGGELPDWLSFDPVTRKFTGVPPTDYQGQLKLLVTAIDEFGESASDILTLQFGDNQAPVLDNPSEKIVQEDAGMVALKLKAPVDPEGKAVTVKLLETPTLGAVLDKAGNQLTAGAVLTADALSELHYQTQADANGNAGYLRYQAIDEDGVTAESSVHLFIEAVNDAPRFATTGSKLVIQYPAQATVTLDMASPSDPESAITTVKLVDLPALGTVSLDGQPVKLDQVLTLDQLQRLSFTLAENVNGPIGSVTVQAVDEQGLATQWSLALEVQGEAASNVGTAGTDELYGSIGNDTLYGMGGDDKLVGNAGNDRLLGGLGNDSLFGGSGNDALDGSSGNDYLDGGLGNDTMTGGPGHDTYLVDSATDVVLEVISGGAGGKDLIVTSVTLTAPTNVESLQAAATHAINLSGNDLDNTLLGNELDNRLLGAAGRDTLIGGAGHDTLDGGSGVDKLAGGSGDDVYWVDARSDLVVELVNDGVDTVHASTHYTLTSNIENLYFEEGGDYSAGGNSLNNHIRGNSGNNILAGGLGKDTLEGGLGDDIYVLNDSLDTITDTGGKDTVRSSLDIELQAGLENAELVGITDTTAIGNAADNLLVGNMGSNLLDGGAGVDTLTGGEGSDQFMLAFNGAGVGPDCITDFVAGNDLLVVDLASFGVLVDQFGLESSGAVSAEAFVKGAGVKALDPNDHFLLDTAQGLLMFDPDGSGTAGAVGIAKFIGLVDPALSGNDIYLAV